jgi:hypothetical protein
MHDLEVAVDSLMETIEAAGSIAEAHEGKRTDALRIQANLLFLKMVTQGTAVVRAIPVGPLTDPNLPIWDLSTAASNARSILESYLIFYYLFVETVSTERKHFRFAIWLRHGLAENQKFRAVSGSPDPADWACSVSDAQNSISENRLFGTLDANQQRNALAGERSTFPKFETLVPQILTAAGISKDLWDLAYRYCSSFVHTTFFTVEQLERINARTREGLAPFAMIAKTTNIFLLLAARDYTKVFPAAAAAITADLAQRFSNTEAFAKMTSSDWITASQAPVESSSEPEAP